MFRGQVVSIHVAMEAKQPAQSVAEARAVPGKGLEGDRYFHERGTYSTWPGGGRELTLIEIEAIEALGRELGIALAPGATRRNVVTRGVPLNHLVGRDFRIGEVIVRGIRLCEPCTYLEGLTHEGVKQALVHRGGLRAELLSGGTIHVGDEIVEVEPPG